MTHINMANYRLTPRPDAVRIIRVVYACDCVYAMKVSAHANADDIVALRQDAAGKKCDYHKRYGHKGK